MKRQNNTIHQQVEKTLALLDDTERVTAGPWFHARLRTKIDGLTRQTDRRVAWTGFGLLRPALLAVVVAVNLATVFMTFRQTEQSSAGRRDRQEALSAFAVEYQFTGNTGLLEAYSTTTEQ